MIIKKLDIRPISSDLYASSLPDTAVFAKGETEDGHGFVVYKRGLMIYAAVKQLNGDEGYYADLEEESSGDMFIGDRVPESEGSFIIWDYCHCTDFVPQLGQKGTVHHVMDIIGDITAMIDSIPVKA